jgi:hypothetical protein
MSDRQDGTGAVSYGKFPHAISTNVDALCAIAASQNDEIHILPTCESGNLDGCLSAQQDMLADNSLYLRLGLFEAAAAFGHFLRERRRSGAAEQRVLVDMHDEKLRAPLQGETGSFVERRRARLGKVNGTHNSLHTHGAAPRHRAAALRHPWRRLTLARFMMFATTAPLAATRRSGDFPRRLRN